MAYFIMGIVSGYLLGLLHMIYDLVFNPKGAAAEFKKAQGLAAQVIKAKGVK